MAEIQRLQENGQHQRLKAQQQHTHAHTIQGRGDDNEVSGPAKSGLHELRGGTAGQRQEKEKRHKEANEIYRLRQQVINERRKEAKWAGLQMAMETAAHKKKTAELQGKLAQALSLLQLNNNERELEDWKKECGEARAESNLESDANREATRVSMDTNNTLRIHVEDL